MIYNIRIIWLDCQTPIHSLILRNSQRIVLTKALLSPKNALLVRSNQPTTNFWLPSQLLTNACNLLWWHCSRNWPQLKHQRRNSEDDLGKDQNLIQTTSKHLILHQGLGSDPTEWKDKYGCKYVLIRIDLGIGAMIRLIWRRYLAADRLSMGARGLGRDRWGQLNNFDLLGGRDAIDGLSVFVIVDWRSSSSHSKLNIWL